MKKKVAVLLLSMSLAVPFSVSAAPQKTSETIFPATETTVNGVPESKIVRPMDVMVGPIFAGYSPSSYITNDRFKPIVQFDHDNRRNSSPYTMSVNVTKSEAQGSEWSGSVNFTAEIKAGILGKVNTTAGVEHKQTRATNEAVGVTGSFTVSAGKMGHIKFWYKGKTTKGTLRHYSYNTANPSQKYYTDTPINATFYRSNYLDVFSEAWQN